VFVDGSLSPLQVLGLWGTLFVFTVLARSLARAFARRVVPVERCLFVGSESSCERLRVKLVSTGARAVVVGRMSLGDVVDDDSSVAVAVAELRRLIDELRVHRVVLEPSEPFPKTTLDFLREAKGTGARVSLLPRILEVVGSSIEVDDLHGLTLLGVRRFGLSRSSLILKRSFDAIGSALGLFVLAPVLLVLGLIVRLDSRGPAIYKQTRIGRDGRPFTMWKFRTMVRDAEARKADLADSNQQQGPLFKLRQDPRITRAGSWLRRWSLDELPQLMNVVSGDMSLVGPRPALPEEAAMYRDHVRRRLAVKPGMTGLWQVNGRADLSWDESVRLDLRYVENWSFMLDLQILWKTGAAVIRGSGAY